MNDPIATLEWLLEAQPGIPSLQEMPRRTLEDKGIAGPTAAHVIEEIHTPLNGAGHLHHRQQRVSEYRRRHAR